MGYFCDRHDRVVLGRVVEELWNSVKKKNQCLVSCSIGDWKKNVEKNADDRDLACESFEESL